jgi:hypothetical protein
VNWNVRREAVRILETIEGRGVVPAAVAALPGELRLVAQNHREHHIDDYVLDALVGLLAARTGQAHGKDVPAWLTWWEDAAPAYGAPAPRFDLDAARRLQAEYQELFGPPRR